MEITLLYNQPLELPLNRPGTHYDFCSDGGEVITTILARQTHPLEIPITCKLVEDLEANGITSHLTIGKTVTGPKIAIGFKEFVGNLTVHQGFMNVSSTSFLGRFFALEARQKNNFKLRLDIESFKATECDCDNCNMRPVQTSREFRFV